MREMARVTRIEPQRKFQKANVLLDSLTNNPRAFRVTGGEVSS
jgi:hypothetical protein